jgi:hypothetical protein
MKKLLTLFALSIFLNGFVIAQEYINETFDSDIPSDWTVTSESDANPWFWIDDDFGSTVDGNTGFVMVDSDAAGSGAVDLIENLDTPDFDATAGNIVIVSFDQYFNQLGNDEISVEVWDGTDWNVAYSYSGPGDIGAWSPNAVHTTVIITDHINTSGDTKVRFRYIDGGSWAWWWAIDNIVVESVDCLEPQNLAISQLGAVSAIAVWASGSGSSNLAYGPSGFDINDIVATDGTLVNDVSSPYLIEGLSPETSYEFYVQDDCGLDGMSGWSGPVAFTTTEGCPSPIFNGFSNPSGNSIDITFTQGVGDVYIIYGEENFVLGSAGDTSGIATSTYTLSGLDALTFYDVYLYLDCTGDAFGYSDVIGPFSFNTLVDGPGTDCGNPIVLNGNLPYEEEAQSICGYGNNITTGACGWYQGYEEIVFAYSPESEDETIGVYGSNSETESSIYFEITNMCPDSTGATCVASGIMPWNAENFLLSADLEMGETYFITLSGYTGVGCIFDLQIFIIECESPTSLSSIAGIDGTELNWVSNSDASNFQVEWGLAGFIPGTGTTVDGEYGVDGPPIELTGLSDTESYEFYVTDICGIGVTSLSSGPATFTGPPPANDLCSGAIEIECGDIVNGNTDNATDAGNPAFCGTNVSAPGVWYSFTGTGDDIELSLCGSDYDTKLFLYSGSCAALECVGGNDDNFTQCPTNGLNSYIYASTELGETYYVFVSGYSLNTGLYTLEYTCITCPLINTLTVSATDVNASVNWVTTNIGAEYIVEYGPLGFTPGSGTEVNGTVGTDGPPAAISGLSAGTSYDVYVYEICDDGETTSTLNTTFTTNLLPPPANDLCSGAFELSCGDLDSGSTEYATQIGNPVGPLCGFATLNSNAVWYEIAGNDQLATLSTCGSNFDTELFVFTGSCDSLQCHIMADGNPGTCEWGSSELSFFAESGVTYYVAVAGWSAFYSGDYYISYECNPCGDPNTIQISTTDVSADVSWNSYLPGADFTLVYGEVGFDWADGTEITGNNATDVPVNITGLLASETYQVCVYEYCEAEMTNTDTICTIWTTNALPPPANDAACNAVELINGEVLETTNIYASTQLGEPVPPATGCAQINGWCNSNLTSSTWYTYTTPEDGILTVSTCHAGSYDTQLAIYEASDCGDFDTYNLIAANDDAIGGCSAATFASTLSMCVESGVTYYIQVDPYGFAGQDFLISLDFEEAAISNLMVDASSGDAIIDWVYSGPNDVEYSILYYNTITMDYDTIFGNTADLPVTILGIDNDVEYEFYIYCEDACGTSEGPSTFMYVTGIEELSFGKTVKVYPNPVRDLLTLEVNAELEKGTSISILSIQGKVVYNEAINSGVSEYRNEIDVSNFAPGVYMIQITNGKTSVQERIIIQ